MTKRSPLFTLFFTIFLDMLGVGFLIPVLPLLFTNPASSHYLLTSGIPASQGYLLLGLLIGLYSLGQFFSAPIIGQLSDKFGRKRPLIFSIIGNAASHGLFAFGLYLKFIPLLFIARIVGGITAGNIVVAQAAIADVSKPEDRAKNFGLIGAAFGLGFIIGPFMGGRLADPALVSWFSPVTPFWVAAILSSINALLVVRNFRETHQSIVREKKIEWGKAVKNIVHAMKLERVRPFLITNFLYQTGFTFYTTFATVYFFARFGMTEAMLGNYFAYVGLWVVFAQAVLTREAAKRWAGENIIKHTLIGTGLMILIIVLLPRASWLLLTTPIFAAMIGLSNANLTALISRSAGPEIQGEILGLNGSVTALAMMLPPLVAGFIVAATDPAASLIVASILTIIAGVYFNGHLRSRGTFA